MDSSQFTALLQVLGRIAAALEGQYALAIDQLRDNATLAKKLDHLSDSLELIAEDMHDGDEEPYLNILVNHLEQMNRQLQQLNTHPGFEAIQSIASTLDSIRRLGIPVEQG